MSADRAAVGWLRGEALHDRASRVIGGLGLGTALLASLMVAGAAVAGMIATAGEGSDRLPPGAADARAEQPTPVIPADDDELVETYAPVLGFTKDERWTPITIDAYLSNRDADTQLLGPGGAKEHPRQLADLSKTCGDARRSACWHLTIDCEEARLDCADGHVRKAGTLHRDGATYVRVLRRDRPPGDGSGDVFAHLPSQLAGKNLSVLLQYWYFYRYDEWASPVVAGRLVQRHEGDWEAVMVGLAPDQPLFVAYSAHCGGTWRWWKNVRMSAASSPWTHPLVASAEGSHANYPKAGPQSPNWTSCSRIPDGTAEALTYASNVRERTDYAWQWYPRELIRVDAAKLPMSFPGTWGRNDRSTLENFAHHDASPSGGGPMTPTLQPLWQRPLPRVFCNQYWHGPVRPSRNCGR